MNVHSQQDELSATKYPTDLMMSFTNVVAITTTGACWKTFNFPKKKEAHYLTIGSRFSVHYRVMEHAGSLECTKEASELPEAIAEGNSSFLSALQTSQVLRNSIVHS